MTTNTSPSIPNSHPLLLELSSLRQQLAQYQKSSHQSAIQLQGARLELTLARDETLRLRSNAEYLLKEVEVLRSNPSVPSIPPQSTSLTQLSLAHRRLSSKLDLTEQQLHASQLELAATKQEVGRLVKDKEGQRGVINDLRRVEEDWEEEIEWERGERRRVEEQKKLCDLALKEYEKLVHSLSPDAVPPLTPSSGTTPNILHTTPDLSTSPKSLPTTLHPSTPTSHSTQASPSETISNLLEGQRGVQRLFTDFQSALSAKEKSLHVAQARIDELEHTLSTLQSQLHDESALRVHAECERDKALRDDGSAARVVERYMTFTQKTHATLHMHLENLRERSNSTIGTLRGEVGGLRVALKSEVERGERVRGAMEEVAEGFSRESAGRRREVGLRLGMLLEEEKRERRVEGWLDKVRRAREGAEGAVLEADVLEVLLDEGVEAVSYGDEGKKEEKGGRQRGWKGMLGTRKSVGAVKGGEKGDGGEESSLMRVLLAEELVDTLVRDLQVETDRRMELERQRVEWLAKDAVGGVDLAVIEGDQVDGVEVFDVENHEDAYGSSNGHGSEAVNGSTPTDEVDLLGDDSEQSQSHPKSDPVPPPEVSPALDNGPLIVILQDIINPLTERHTPLQTSLHDLSSSLALLRNSLPTQTPTSTTSPTKKSTFRNLSLKPSPPTADPALTTLLDSIHEVIEDARVDLEIAVADIERVYRGFEALLGVGGNGAVQGSEVLKDAREYVEDRESEGEKGSFGRLRKKVEDLEHDLVVLKRTVHEVEGMEIGQVEDDIEDAERKKTRSIWSDLPLRTVMIAQPPSTPGQSIQVDPRRRTTGLLSSVGNVGRSFSSSVVGTPRRAVSGFAGGLYKGKKGKVNGKAEEESLINARNGDQVEDDDVE